MWTIFTIPVPSNWKNTVFSRCSLYRTVEGEKNKKITWVSRCIVIDAGIKVYLASYHHQKGHQRIVINRRGYQNVVLVVVSSSTWVSTSVPRRPTQVSRCIVINNVVSERRITINKGINALLSTDVDIKTSS